MPKSQGSPVAEVRDSDANDCINVLENPLRYVKACKKKEASWGMVGTLKHIHNIVLEITPREGKHGMER